MRCDGLVAEVQDWAAGWRRCLPGSRGRSPARSRGPGQAALPAGPTAVAATLYLGVVASGGTLLLWTYGAAHTPAGLSGILTAGISALGYAFAVLAGEQATWGKTAGGILAVAGVLLATHAATRSTSGKAPSPATSSR